MSTAVSKALQYIQSDSSSTSHLPLFLTPQVLDPRWRYYNNRRIQCCRKSPPKRARTVLMEAEDNGEINGVKRVWDGILRSLRIESNGYLIENLPDPEIRCACGSGYSYERCCRKYHLGTSSPRTAVELLRARYSAYAYRSPSYVMRTTHWDHEDAARNKKIWKQDLLEFCDDYSFLGLKVLEQRMADHKTTFILFRVDLKTELGKRISFVERGKFLFERGRWLYADGNLLTVEK